MRSPSFTTKFEASVPFESLWHKLPFLGILVLSCITCAASQRVAIVAPDKTDQSLKFALSLSVSLGDKVSILDDILSRDAFDAIVSETPFNLTTEKASSAGKAMGCDYFVLVNSSTLRRSASGRAAYYEASAAVYLVSTRTGELIHFGLWRKEAGAQRSAADELMRSVGPLTTILKDKMMRNGSGALDETQRPLIEEVPDPNAAAAKNFRPPIPYRRIKPNYTSDAAYYDVAATVDLEVDLDVNGLITRTRIVRWAGYGLEESAKNVVRSMNWRPAERNGSRLPIRFLVRYNFKRIEKTDPPL